MQKRVKYFLERQLIVSVIVIIVIICSFFRFNLNSISNYELILTNTITVASIFIAVLMSMLGFLLTVSGRQVVKRISNFGVYKALMHFFVFPMFSGIILVIYSLVLQASILNIKTNVINEILSIVWVMIFTYFFLGFIRIIILVYLILLEVFKEIEGPQIVNNEVNHESINELEEESFLLENEECESELKFDNPEDVF